MSGDLISHFYPPGGERFDPKMYPKYHQIVEEQQLVKSVLGQKSLALIILKIFIRFYELCAHIFFGFPISRLLRHWSNISSRAPFYVFFPPVLFLFNLLFILQIFKSVFKFMFLSRYSFKQTFTLLKHFLDKKETNEENS